MDTPGYAFDKMLEGVVDRSVLLSQDIIISGDLGSN